MKIFYIKFYLLEVALSDLTLFPYGFLVLYPKILNFLKNSFKYKNINAQVDIAIPTKNHAYNLFT